MRVTAKHDAYARERICFYERGRRLLCDLGRRRLDLIDFRSLCCAKIPSPATTIVPMIKVLINQAVMASATGTISNIVSRETKEFPRV